MLNFLKSRDHLQLNDVQELAGDNAVNHRKNVDGAVPKSAQLLKGLNAVKHHVFRPSLWSFNWIGSGHCQTMMVAIKNKISSAFFGEISYDKREEFTLSDGGKIYLDFKGASFVDENVPKRPLVMLCLGLVSSS